MHKKDSVQEIKQMQMQSTYWLENVLKMISLYGNAQKVHWRTRRSFSAPSLTSKYFAFAFV